MRLHYRTRSQEKPISREVDPFKLIFSWGQRYCIGYCHLRQALRSFRLDRIFELEILEQTFAEPIDFDFQAFIASNSLFQSAVQVRLRFEQKTALVALNNQEYWESCEEQSDGAVITTFTAPDLDTAASMVLKVGFPAIILEPEALHEQVRIRARALADHFEATSGLHPRHSDK